MRRPGRRESDELQGSAGGCVIGPARWRRVALRAVGVFLPLLGFSGSVRAQSIEPRLFSNAPVGLNFMIVGFARSTGGVVLDATIPLEDADITIDAPLLGYARVLDVAGLSGQIQVLVPYAWLSGEAVLSQTGEVVARDVHGFGDPGVRFAVNLHGAPALSVAEFGGYRQDLVVGVSLLVTAPLGQYDPDRLVNLGTNRWLFRPEFGFSKALRRFIFEATGSVNLYTDNNDFFGGQHRSQDPLYAAQGHVIYRFQRSTWVALDATYYTGGRTTLDGVEGDDLQKNWRVGLTAALPVNRRNSIKVYASEGVYTRFGSDFVLAGMAWQYHWGGGM